jgi:tRNA A-37 threonylcarbamoyl transferase component Bud32
MNTETNTCPNCGAAIPAGAAHGLCPKCVFIRLGTATEDPTVPAARPAPPSLAEIAAAFPQLEIIEFIGQGGMGCVFKARQPQLGRFVALKILPADRAREASFAERFVREAQALAALNHPNIVTIHDFGQSGGFYFLLMEFVDGVNLRQAMKAGRFTPEQALAVVPPVCDALQFAHERGIVHRDIKPENLLLDKDGRVKIADFGIAKMLGTPADGLVKAPPLPDAAGGSGPDGGTLHTVAGTPQYMAPEQRDGAQRTDHRTDIYSLGVVLYELLTGELPGANLQPPSRKVQIDVRLDEVVLRALESKPELRYATAAEFRTQVETFAGGDAKAHAQPTVATSTVRILKTGNGVFATPGRLATFTGQFFHYRTRGQLVLDDTRLTLSRPGEQITIPLEAIRDLSIGEYPRSMNPAGLDFISVTFAEAGTERRIIFAPSEGIFGLPQTWRDRVAEWHAAIREATLRRSGKLPAFTPREQLPRIPGSRAGWLVIALPLLAALLPGIFLLWPRPGGQPPDMVRLMALMAPVGVLLVFGMGMWLTRRQRAGGTGAFRNAGWLLLLPLLIIVAMLAVYFFPLLRRVSAPPAIAITNVQHTVMGESNNVLFAELDFRVEGDEPVEMRVEFTGPPLPRAVKDALPRENGDHGRLFASLRAGTNNAQLLVPGILDQPRPRVVFMPGTHKWQIGCAFPSQEIAAQARGSFRPPVLRMVPGSGAEETWTLFETGVGAPVYQARIVISPRLTAANPNWVSVSGRSMLSTDTMQLTWQILASRPGMVRVLDGNSSDGSKALAEGRGGLHEAEMRLEITRLDTNRVRFHSSLSNATGRRQGMWELEGDFAKFAAEMAGTARFSARSTRNTEIELCRINDRSYRVQVMNLPETGRPAAPAQTGAPLASDGIAMFGPVTGAGVGSNQFRCVTSLVRPRDLALFEIEIEGPDRRTDMRQLSFVGSADSGQTPAAINATWTATNDLNGMSAFHLHATGPGRRVIDRTMPLDWLRDFVWQATPPARSFWVGPGEWHLNDTNAVPIFTGVNPKNPAQTAVVRLRFSLHPLPPAAHGVGDISVIYPDWRTTMNVPKNAVFPVTPLVRPDAARGLASAREGTDAPVPAPQTTLRPSWGRISVIGLLLLGLLIGGVVLLVVLVLLRKRLGVLGVLAILAGFGFLLVLLLGGAALFWVREASAEQLKAANAEQAERIEEVRKAAERERARSAPPQPRPDPMQERN